MKKLFKFFGVVFLLIIAFMLGVLYMENKETISDIKIFNSGGNNEEAGYEEEIKTENKTNEEILTVRDVKYTEFDAAKKIEYLLSYKDRSIEMEYNENGYTDDELFTAVLPTMVSIENHVYSRTTGETYTFTTGNIYDIDENYIYIISCEHGYKSKIYDITLRFVDGFYLTLPPDNVFVHDVKDISLILVDKKDVPLETLNLLKSINIEHLLEIPLTNMEEHHFYAYKYFSKEYTTSKVGSLKETFSNPDDLTTLKRLEISFGSFANGTSGGGIFDQYGTYHSFVVYGDGISTNFLTYIDEMITLSNPNYYN